MSAGFTAYVIDNAAHFRIPLDGHFELLRGETLESAKIVGVVERIGCVFEAIPGTHTYWFAPRGCTRREVGRLTVTTAESPGAKV